MFKVALICDEDDRGRIGDSHAINKFLVFQRLVEASSRDDGVTYDEAFACSHVLLPHHSKLRLQNND